MKKLLLLTAVLTAVVLAGSTAMALAPLGPPTSDLKCGQFGVGIDYAYDSTKVKVDSTTDRLKTNMLSANLGYGIMDDWKGYARLGLSSIKEDVFNGNWGFAWGLGTKYTFLKQDKLDWGALFQLDWLRSSDKIDGVNAKIKPYDIVLAVGPTYQISDTVSIYGGPLLQWVRGSVSAGDVSAQIREKQMFGGYFGAEAKLCEMTSVFGEIQFTGTGWGIGTGINWKF
jgi:hypothetical protein